MSAPFIEKSQRENHRVESGEDQRKTGSVYARGQTEAPVSSRMFSPARSRRPACHRRGGTENRGYEGTTTPNNNTRGDLIPLASLLRRETLNSNWGPRAVRGPSGSQQPSAPRSFATFVRFGSVRSWNRSRAPLCTAVPPLSFALNFFLPQFSHFAIFHEIISTISSRVRENCKKIRSKISLKLFHWRLIVSSSNRNVCNFWRR